MMNSAISSTNSASDSSMDAVPINNLYSVLLKRYTRNSEYKTHKKREFAKKLHHYSVFHVMAHCNYIDFIHGKQRVDTLSFLTFLLFPCLITGTTYKSVFYQF